MALDPTPWFVGGGAKHSPEVARAMAYAATNGAEGITGAGDLKVQAQGVPNNTVQVLPGGALLLNRYPGGAGQTYTLRNATATNVQITATGSGAGRTDLVVARILDPQYEGQPPANPNSFDYSRLTVIQGVPAGTKTAKELNLGYPAIELARIAIPASTATITNAMITKLGKVARPQITTRVHSGSVTPEVKMQSATGLRWPSFQPTVDVPEWATYMTMVATISSVGHLGGDAEGVLTATLGEAGAAQWRAPNTFYDLEQGPWEGERHAFIIGGEGKIDPSLRGTTQKLATEGRFMAGPGYLITKPGTHVIYQVQFQELAD